MSFPAREPAEPLATAGGVTPLVHFVVGGVRYAVPGRMVRALPVPSPLPRFMSHREQVFRLLDVPKLLGVPAGEERLLVLIQDEERRSALVIEELVGFEGLDPRAVQPVPEVYPADERRRWGGVLLRPDGRLAVLLQLEALETPFSGAGA